MKTKSHQTQLKNYTEPFLSNTLSSKGGVAIFAKNHQDVFERDDLKKEGNKEFEAVWIEIKKKGSKNIVVGCLYRHPHSSNLQDFSSYINSCLIKLNKETKEVYITGDFNIDLLKYESNSNYREFYNLVTSNGFLPLILQPTRITDSTRTLIVIDNIFTNAFTRESISGNILIEFADHLTQFASIRKLGCDPSSAVFYKRCNKNWKEEDFLHDLSTQTWSNETNPGAKLGVLMAYLTSCVDKHLPRKKLTKREIKMKSKPWINSVILRKIKHRNDLFCRKKADPDNNYLKSAYNRFRNSVNRDIKTSKQKYYNSYFENCQNNIKKTWKGINELISSIAKSPVKVNQIKSNDTLIDDPTMIANSFNNFFVNVGPNLDKEIPKTPISPLSYLKSRVVEDFVFSLTCNAEVMMLILKLDDSKSGPDTVPTNVFKIAAPIIVPHLVSIFNLSLQSGIFPDPLKLAKVIPIFKAGSKLLVTNYRPISLLPILSKIFEKIVHKQLFEFLELKAVIYESQFGFQKNKSTLHSLVEIIETIRDCIDKTNYGCGVFIDLKKAFDTVNHNILIQKLEHYGVRGSSLNWFSSYLTGRIQFTYCNSVESDKKIVTCGVPQGSVLGPLLFLLYINDLPNISKKLKFYLFADDTNIFYQSKDLDSLQSTVNKELKKLSLWLNANRLALNISKTNFVIFAAKNKPLKNVTLLLNNKAFAQKDHVKYLGILIDSQLTFQAHTNSVSKKIARVTGMMYRIRKFVNDKTLRTIYNSLIYPFILYGVPIWGNADELHIEPIHKIQKKAVRIISNKVGFIANTFAREHSAPLFKELKLLNIYDIYKVEALKFVYDSLHKNNPPQFHTFYSYPTNQTSTAANRESNLNTPQVRTSTYGLKSLKYTGVMLWNGLSAILRNLPSKKCFGKAVKKQFLENYN